MPLHGQHGTKATLDHELARCGSTRKPAELSKFDPGLNQPLAISEASSARIRRVLGAGWVRPELWELRSPPAGCLGGWGCHQSGRSVWGWRSGCGKERGRQQQAVAVAGSRPSGPGSAGIRRQARLSREDGNAAPAGPGRAAPAGPPLPAPASHRRAGASAAPSLPGAAAASSSSSSSSSRAAAPRPGQPAAVSPPPAGPQVCHECRGSQVSRAHLQEGRRDALIGVRGEPGRRGDGTERPGPARHSTARHGTARPQPPPKGQCGTQSPRLQPGTALHPPNIPSERKDVLQMSSAKEKGKLVPTTEEILCPTARQYSTLPSLCDPCRVSQAGKLPPEVGC
ncbi:uncharacterized protein LOC141923800 [Strix aluco]|uniref:uncharacterized protein LOC141923800 n=1 Tax=Strix aluco TaxID=111821 RepID=UPI003DA6BFA6